MVKKIQKNGSDKKASAQAFNSPLSGAIKDSAQQIWLAGLGAFAKAQEEGGKAFESLVKEGLSIQRKTQAVAEGRISEATNKVSSVSPHTVSMAHSFLRPSASSKPCLKIRMLWRAYSYST